jgi:hypothetical protein
MNRPGVTDARTDGPLYAQLAELPQETFDRLVERMRDRGDRYGAELLVEARRLKMDRASETTPGPHRHSGLDVGVRPAGSFALLPLLLEELSLPLGLVFLFLRRLLRDDRVEVLATGGPRLGLFPAQLVPPRAKHRASLNRCTSSAPVTVPAVRLLAVQSGRTVVAESRVPVEPKPLDTTGFWLYQAEGEGFEPSSDPEARNGFRDRRIRPLCHPSEGVTGYRRAGAPHGAPAATTS